MEALPGLSAFTDTDIMTWRANLGRFGEGMRCSVNRFPGLQVWRWGVMHWYKKIPLLTDWRSMWALSSTAFSWSTKAACHRIRGRIHLVSVDSFTLLSKSDIFRAHIWAIFRKRTRSESRTPLHAPQLHFYIDEAVIYQKDNWSRRTYAPRKAPRWNLR
jgi:hypothetical protein